MDTHVQPVAKPGPEQKALRVFSGRWKIDGRSRPSPSDPEPPQGDEVLSVRMQGWNTIEPLPGEFFVMQRGETRVGNVAFNSTWMLGFDDDAGTYRMWLFDDANHAVEYSVSVDGNVWSVSGIEQRATFTFMTPNRMRQQWFVREAGRWAPLCDIECLKAP